ncbi:MAG: glycosyltransferase 87 family protein, partial [Chloroflexota bacterium]
HIAASDEFAFDAQAYYLANGYDLPVGGTNAFLYSPPVLLALRFIASVVPWPIFLELYTLAIGVGAWVLAGPVTPFVILTPQVASEITLGNIHIFLALVAVAGFRWPALWSFALLTKVTPGLIGVLWFVFRAEWRAVAWILGVTAVIAVPTMVVAPDLWVAWIQRLVASSGSSDASLAVPLVVRLPVAIAITFIGARRDQRWVVPLAALVALPVIWDVHSLSMLLGVVWFARRDLGPWIRRIRPGTPPSQPVPMGTGS